MLLIEIVKLELMDGHIRIMLIVEIKNLEFPGGHIEIMLFIVIVKLESNSHITISINSIFNFFSDAETGLNEASFSWCNDEF